MSDITQPKRDPAAWRIWLFRILAALLGLFSAVNVTNAVWPWIPSIAPHVIIPTSRWAIPLSGGIDAMAGLALIYLAWRPRQGPVFLQWYALAIVASVHPGFTDNVSGSVGFALIIGVPPIVAYPWPRELLVPPWRDGIRRPLLVLALVAGPPLLVDAWNALQKFHIEPRLLRDDWSANAEHLIDLWLAMLLAASRRPSRNLVAVMAGLDLLYLGAVAISFPSSLGSWGYLGGSLSVLAGLLYLADVVRVMKRHKSNPILKAEPHRPPTSTRS